MFGYKRRRDNTDEPGNQREDNHAAASKPEVADDVLNKKVIENLRQVNGLLKHITEMDYVKDMLLDVSKQTDMIDTVASGGEELTASIEDVSNFVQNANASASNSVATAGEAVTRIDEAFAKIEKTFEATKDVQATMDKVNTEAARINDIVALIKSVADQTNLLALNASIEAARAGEHGRGFSVVAEEIRKLAESTREQVAFITEIVGSLTGEIEKADEALEISTATFAEGKTEMTGAVDGLQGVKSSLDGIAADFKEITANIEEQTASAQEMASAIMVINEKAKRIGEDTDKTGLSFSTISNMVNDIRLALIKDSKDLDMTTQVELCISDHLIWRWRVYNMILGYEHLDESQVGTHHTCRLGKWADNAEIDNQEMRSIRDKLSVPHEQLHSYAKEAIAAYNQGKKAVAEERLEDMDRVSVQVVGYLEDLERINTRLRQ